VESADVCAIGGAESSHPLAHFFGGFIGEGYCANIVWPNPGINKRRNPICNYAGLAASRACKNKQWAFNVKNRFFLRMS
jgi:hypothetical protein